jgi:sRNA-binding carbon storage regulator CsrA
MLVLTKKVDEFVEITIDGKILLVKIIEVKKNKVRLGIIDDARNFEVGKQPTKTQQKLNTTT